MTVRVLLIDDDGGLRAELRTLLEDGGYRVVGEASGGREGIALVGVQQPDLVITDLKMPDGSGLDVAAALAGQVPVIILSAFDDEGLQAQARELGAAFLVKGCRSRTIFSAVDTAALSCSPNRAC